MNISVTITPGLDPLDRGDIEDAVLDALGEHAELLGGGTMLGEPTVSDFSIELSSDDPRSAEDATRACRSVLDALSFTLPTTVTLEVDGQHTELRLQPTPS